MKTRSAALALGALLATISPAVAGSATHRPRPAITMAQARAIALHRAPGKVTKAEYESEGAGWRYSFDIAQGRRIHEIGVDAGTGQIVEDAYEAPGGED